MWQFSTLLLLFIFYQVNCWKFLHFGRISGGNLGKPHHENVVASDSFPEQWFLQKLDHFNPNNEVTWNQVSFKLKKILPYLNKWYFRDIFLTNNLLIPLQK